MIRSQLAILAGLTAALAGCGGGGGGGGGGGAVVADPFAALGGAGTAVTLASPVVTPARFSRFVGGAVTVTATLTPTAQVASVVARLRKSSTGQAQPDVALTQQGTTTLFQAATSVPANLRVDGQSEFYTVTIIITDRNGAQRNDEVGVVEVPSPLGDPAAPGGVPAPPF